MDAVRLVVVALPATDITHEGFTANWTKNNVATGYLLDVATDSDFENIIINALAAGNVTSRIITGLDPGTDYYYRVTALDGPGTGHYSNVIEVTTETVALGYGLLYNWYAATDERNIAAEGWHVPTKTEFEELIDELGGVLVAGAAMKETGTDHWLSDPGNTNSSGFTARGAGRRDRDAFRYLQNVTYFIAATTAGANYYYLGLTESTATVTLGSVCSLFTGGSIRLIKDDSTDPGIMTGNDGKQYLTVKIGDQVWMAENSCETQYRNGDPIPEITNQESWAAATSGAMCAYDNDWGNV